MIRGAWIVFALALSACDRPGREPHSARPAVPFAPARAAAAELDPAVAAKLDTLAAAVKAAPADHPAADRYREAALEHGATRRAIAFFEQLAADGAAGREANVHLQLGMAYLDALEQSPNMAKPALTTRALAAFDAALERDAMLWDARYARALVYLRMPAGLKQFPKAIETFSELVEWQRHRPARPEFALTYLRLSEAYLRAGDRPQATATLRTGLRHFPAHPALVRGLEFVERGEPLP